MYGKSENTFAEIAATNYGRRFCRIAFGDSTNDAARIGVFA